jgi:hypothetical protein
MLKLVLENVTFTSRAAEAPRVFTTESAFASALMKDRVFTLLGSVDERGVPNRGHFLNRNQRELVRQYVSYIEQKMAEGHVEGGNLLTQIKLAAKNIELSKAPRSPVELAGQGALILLPLGNMVMIYHILSPFEALMCDPRFKRNYYYTLEEINSNTSFDEDLDNYIEHTATMAGHTEPSSLVIALETVATEDTETLARAYAITRVFGMEE